MSRACPPVEILFPLLEEECRVVARLSDLCSLWRASLAAGTPSADGETCKAIDTLCMRFRALESEVGRLLLEHGWRREELPEAVRASSDESLDGAYKGLLDSIRGLSRANFINACLLDRWTELNRGLFGAILAAISPTYMPSASTPPMPPGVRLTVEA